MNLTKEVHVVGGGTFAGALRYLPEATADYDHAQCRIESERKEQLLRRQE